MNRQSIIVLIKGNQVEAWGNFKEACMVHGWPYWTLTRKRFPILHDGWRIHKVPFKQQNDG